MHSFHIICTDEDPGTQIKHYEQIIFTWYYFRDGFSYFRSGGWIKIWGVAAACFVRGVVAMPGKAKEKVEQNLFSRPAWQDLRP